MKKPTAQVSMIPTATPPFGLGYKPIDDNLLEMEVRKMARDKAKAKGLPCPLESLKPYSPTLNGKFVKARDNYCYWDDDDKGIDAKSGSSSNNNSSESGHGDDDSNSDSESNNNEDYDSQYSGNDWGEPPSDREDEDAVLYYEEYDDDVDYNDEDIKMMPKLIGEVTLIVTNNVDYDYYPYRRPSNWSCIINVSSRPGP